jgi:short subunit dehydrogenase-like uncharacterized protein
VIYGAASPAGALVSEYLSDFGVPFTTADSRPAPGYEVERVTHAPAALAELFMPAHVVCNLMSPFFDTASIVVQACLGSGTHYLDIATESEWILNASLQWNAQFAAQDLLLCPGVGAASTDSESDVLRAGLLCAYAASVLLREAPRNTGFSTAAQAFGHRELISVLRSFGFSEN